MNNQTIRRGFRLLVPFLLTVLTLASITGMAQFESVNGKKPVVDISDSVNANYARLSKEYGGNKVMPKGYEKIVLDALSYFPELASIKIKCRIIKSTGNIISTRPTLGSVFRKSSKRSYLVTIYDSTAGRTLPVFSNAEVNGQVGILGHELCHILYFNRCTGFGLLGLGVAHISKRFMDRFEYKTDSVDVERGLGYQLIAWKQYLGRSFKAMHTNEASGSEKPVIHGRYMSVEQVQRMIAKNKQYQ